MQILSVNRRFLVFLTLVILLSDCCAVADDQVKKAETEAKTEQEIEIENSLEQYKLFVDNQPEPLTVLPVLTWNNPVAGSFGKYRTVLFIQDGQAKAACCIWVGNNQLYHEFGTLTRSSLRGELNGASKWTMDAGCIKFRPIPETDSPADDRRLRLLQMKRLIDRFTAIETMSRKGEPTEEHLRLLPTPLYRYEKESDQIIDGAVFAFVHTTDPEALVVLEAVKSGNGLRWEYLFVRRTTMPVIGKLDKKQVWSTNEEGLISFQQLPYVK